MANRIKGITVEIGGDTTKLTDALNGVNKEIKNTQSQLRDVEKLLKLDPGNTELLAQKHRLLGDAVSETKDKLQTLKTAAEQANTALRDGSVSQSQYDALQREIIETEQALERLEEQARQSSVAVQKIAQTGADLQQLGGKITNIGSAIAPLSGAVAGLGAAAFASVPATEELRSDLSKLDQAAKENAVSVDAVRKVWQDFAVASDETDSAVEATANLLQAGFTESNLQKAMEGITGAYLKFPDTLKMESLADSLQETLATGEATGQFAELIDRLGGSTDDFNLRMQSASTQAERMDQALLFLSENGLNANYEAWRKNNDEMLANKEANLNLQEQYAALAQTLLPIVTSVVNGIAALLKWFSSLDSIVRNLILVIGGIIAVAAPLLTVIGNVITAVGTIMSIAPKIAGVINIVKTAFAALNATMLANPIFLIIAAIAALVAAFIYLWNNCEGFRQFWIGLWENIKQIAVTVWNAVRDYFTAVWTSIQTVFQTVLEAIKTVVTTYFSIYKTVIETAFNVIKTVISTALNTIKSIFTTVWNAVKTIIQAAVSGIKALIVGDFEGVKNAILTIMTTIQNTLQTIWNTIKNAISSSMSSIFDTVQGGFGKVVGYITGLASQAFTWGKDMVMGIVNGIRSCIGAVGDAVMGVAQKITSILHFSVPDEGPLTEYESWMPDFMQGLAKGINDNRGLIKKAVSGVASDMLISPVTAISEISASSGTRNSLTSTDILSGITEALKGINGFQGGDIVIPVYLGNSQLDEIIVTAQQRANLRSGGR